MKAIRRALARLGSIIRGHEAADEDLRAEMDAHLEMETERFLRRGLPFAEARRHAILASGGLAQAAERVREQRGIPWIESTAADLRFALRHFRRTPLATATMIVVLSLGIGTTVVLFAVLSSIATMPAPGIARDDALVRVRGTMRLPEANAVHPRLMSWPEVREYAGRTDLFATVAAYAGESAMVEAGEAAPVPFTASLIFATPNYFDVLDVRPALGTAPRGDADAVRSTTAPTAMISHVLWRQRFGGAPDVIGRTIRINDMPVEIAGVAPPRFVGTDGGTPLTVWVPLAAYPQLQRRTSAAFASYDSLFLSTIARLRPGVTRRSATPIVAGMAERAVQQRRGRDAGLTPGLDPALAQVVMGSADVVPLLAGNDRVGDRTDLLVSGAAAGGFALLVLLITCTNVSALMVGLAVTRRREIAVRLSLGASRRRLIGQLLTQSVLLALMAAAVGLAGTAIGIRVIAAAFGDVQLLVDWRVTAATCAVAIVTGLLFGISPALHATRVSVGEVLKSSATSVAASRSRLQRALVVVQITLTQPLLVGLAVVIATMATDMEGDATAGVAEHLAEIELDVWAGRASNEEREARIASAVERVAAMPGVVAAVPAQVGTIAMPVTVHPADRIPGLAYAPFDASLSAAPDGYFDALGIPVMLGRDFDAGERARKSVDPWRPMSTDAVIIGNDLARRLWGRANPLGRRLTVALSQRADSAPMTVVGVVDAAAAGPSDVNGQMRVYVPYAHMYTGMIARTAGPALPLLGEMRRLVAAEAPQMPIASAETRAQREARIRRDVLRAGGAATAGGLLAMLLSAIGLYAVVSLMVGQRTREIGIRTALGAQPARVVRMFFAKGLVLTALGLGLGLPISLIVIRVIDRALRIPLASPPLLGVAIGASVLVVASAAVWIPARRASTIEPVVALRAE